MAFQSELFVFKGEAEKSMATSGAGVSRHSSLSALPISEMSPFRLPEMSPFRLPVPWLKGVTNAQGKAVITTRITALDRTRGSEPPPKRDVVSNREYIIKLQGQKAEDEVRLVMKPGASVKGKSYTVTVIDIQKPRYVPTREGNENK